MYQPRTKLGAHVASAALFILGLVTGACQSSSARYPDGNQAGELAGQTVALLDSDMLELGMGPRAYCSGVWVSDDTILTADHCTDDAFIGDVLIYAAPQDMYEVATCTPGAPGTGDAQSSGTDAGDAGPKALAGEDATAGQPAECPYVPGGARVKGSVTGRSAVLYARDTDHDLALLHALFTPPMHLTAKVTPEGPSPGDFAQSMGHPKGLMWSYSTGVVSAVRPLNVLDRDLTWVQSTTPISGGNSGGGLFNAQGYLIGLCHASVTSGQNLNFFIHPAYIRAFLKGTKE